MMKNKYKLLSLLGLLPFFMQAQLTNNGATIVIEPGATLVVEGDISNTNSGMITNEGTIEVKGNVTNAATITSGAASLVKFSGTADQQVTSGGAVFNDIEMATTNMDVVLMDQMAVDGDINFTTDNNQIVLGTHNLVLGTAASITGADANEYVVADDLGKIVKNTNVGGTFTFEIGDVGNYSPLSVTHSGGYTGTSSIQANLMAINHPNIPDDADDFIERYWSFQNSNITGFSGNLVATYDASDVLGTETDMVGARYESGEWEFLNAAQAGSTISATTTAATTELTGMNFYGKADIKVYLHGAFDGSVMTSSLSLPLTSPYADAPKTVASIPANVTDWIKIETRSAANVVETKTSAFLKTDGTIIDEFGASLPLLKDASTSSIVAIYHRNHLPIRTPSVLDIVTPVQHNFSSGLSQAYDNTSLTTDAMVDMGSGVFGIFRANVSGDTSINIVDFFAAKSNSSPTQTGVYSPFDINLDGTLNIVDFIIAKASTTPTKVAHL